MSVKLSDFCPRNVWKEIEVMMPVDNGSGSSKLSSMLIDKTNTVAVAQRFTGVMTNNYTTTPPKPLHEGKYLNESIGTLWAKSPCIFVGSLIAHTVGVIVMAVWHTIQFAGFALACLLAIAGVEEAQDYVSKNAGQQVRNFASLLAAPLAIAVALYGAISPLLALLSDPISQLWTNDSLTKRTHDMLRDARKVYASCERALYGASLIAPCFQPKAPEKWRKPCVPHVLLGMREHLFGGKGANAW